MDANKLSLCGEESFGTGKSAFPISPIMVVFLLLVVYSLELGIYLSSAAVNTCEILKYKKGFGGIGVEMNTMLKIL